MNPTDEASQILTRLFESLARLNRKTLNARSKADITRACELLSHAGEQYGDLFDDLPPRPRNEFSTVSFEVPPEVDRWKAQRGER